MLNKIFIVSISSFKNHGFDFNFNFQLKPKVESRSKRHFSRLSGRNWN